VFVKICGTTNEEDALLSVALGADAVGFVLAPSPRQVTPEAVSDIVKRLPPEIMTVAVFRNMPRDRVVKIALRTGVKAVQLHGSETAEDIAYIRQKLPLVVIKALSAEGNDVLRADEYGADMILLDAPSPGSGRVFDWALAGAVPSDMRVLLAGGLNPDNVAEAIRAVRPSGVDVVSGVESSPGQKDARKLRAFIANAKAIIPAESEHYASSAPPPFDWSTEQ
jgi:phosphoribosylanthranilate isomerase